MVLKNITRQKIIASDIKIAESFFDRLLGLINPENPRSIFYKTRFGIHTFFLKEEIDVIVLSSNFEVVKIKQSLTPFNLFFWNPIYNIVIELPKDSIKRSGTKLKDKLILI